VRFFANESCGQCTPCREGSVWMLKILNRILDGQGTLKDLDLLIELTDTQGALVGKTICGLADGTSWAVKTFINKFRLEFEAQLLKKYMVSKYGPHQKRGNQSLCLSIHGKGNLYI